MGILNLSTWKFGSLDTKITFLADLIVFVIVLRYIVNDSATQIWAPSFDLGD